MFIRQKKVGRTSTFNSWRTAGRRDLPASGSWRAWGGWIG